MQNHWQTHKRIISDVVSPECRWWSSIMCTRRWFSKELPVLLLRCERSLCGKTSERATSLWHYLSTCPSPEATAHMDMLTFVLLELHSRHAWSIGMCTSIKSLRPWPLFYNKNWLERCITMIKGRGTKLTASWKYKDLTVPEIYSWFNCIFFWYSYLYYLSLSIHMGLLSCKTCFQYFTFITF